MTDDPAFVIFGIVFHFFISLAVFRLVIGDCRLKRLHSHHGTVHFFFRELTEQRDNVLVGDFRRFVERHTLDQFRKSGRGGDGAGAAERFKFCVADFAVLIQLEIQFERIAAGDVADFRHGVGVFNLAHIARIEKMIHYFFGIVPHRGILLFQIGCLQYGNLPQIQRFNK